MILKFFSIFSETGYLNPFGIFELKLLSKGAYFQVRAPKLLFSASVKFKSMLEYICFPFILNFFRGGRSLSRALIFLRSALTFFRSVQKCAWILATLILSWVALTFESLLFD